MAGERKMLLINAMPRFDREGQYIGTLVVFTDITQRKHAENQIREANEKLRRNIAEIERRNVELGLLYEMGESLQTCQTRGRDLRRRSPVRRKDLSPAIGGVFPRGKNQRSSRPEILLGKLSLDDLGPTWTRPTAGACGAGRPTSWRTRRRTSSAAISSKPAFRARLRCASR